MVFYFFPDFTQKSGHVFSEICTFSISPGFTKALGCVQECRNLPELPSWFLIVGGPGVMTAQSLCSLILLLG